MAIGSFPCEMRRVPTPEGGGIRCTPHRSPQHSHSLARTPHAFTHPLHLISSAWQSTAIPTAAAPPLRAHSTDPQPPSPDGPRAMPWLWHPCTDAQWPQHELRAALRAHPTHTPQIGRGPLPAPGSTPRPPCPARSPRPRYGRRVAARARCTGFWRAGLCRRCFSISMVTWLTQFSSQP